MRGCNRLLLIFALAACTLPATPQNPPSPLEISGTSGLRVLSLNLDGIKNDATLLEAVRAGGGEPDVMLFQEVVRPAGKLGAVDRLAQRLGMELFFARAYGLRNGGEEGLAIVSRYPLQDRMVIRLPHMNLRWKSRTRIALAAAVQTAKGPIQVFNVHLDSRMGIKQRLKQLQPVTEAAAKFTIPVLIGGDFNTNPYGWLQHTLPLPGSDQSARMAEHMRELGYNSPFPAQQPTSHYFRMHLDWIFTKRLWTEDVAIDPVNFSDHRMLRARVLLRLDARP